MGKNHNNGGGGFDNRTCKLFCQQQNIPKLREDEIYSCLTDDAHIILKQVRDNRFGEKKAKFPQYVIDGFANPSTAKWFCQFVDETVEVKKKGIKTVLDEEQIDALSVILCNGYTFIMKRGPENGAVDFSLTSEMILNTFSELQHRRYMKIKKLVKFDEPIDKEDKKLMYKKLNILTYTDPTVVSCRNIIKILNGSEVVSSRKKTVKTIRKLLKLNDFRVEQREQKCLAVHEVNHPYFVNNEHVYFLKFIASCLAIDRENNAITDHIFEFFDNLSKKERTVILSYYADLYKIVGSSSVHVRTDEFLTRNKKIIKKLIKKDIGYKKAFVAKKKTKIK